MPRRGGRCSIACDPAAMEDTDPSPLVSSSSDSPPRPQPPFKYQFVREPDDEEEEEEEEEDDEDEDLEELEVLERKPAAGLSAAPAPTAPAARAPLLDFGSDFVPPAPRGPLPAAPLVASERQPSWDPSPASSTGPAPPFPSAAAVSTSKQPEDAEPPARPPPPPPVSVSPQPEPVWTPPAPAPAAPPSTPAAPKRRGSSGSVGECRALPPPLPLLCAAPEASGGALFSSPERALSVGLGAQAPPLVGAVGSRVGWPWKPGLVPHCLGFGEHVPPAVSQVLPPSPQSTGSQS